MDLALRVAARPSAPTSPPTGHSIATNAGARWTMKQLPFLQQHAAGGSVMPLPLIGSNERAPRCCQHKVCL